MDRLITVLTSDVSKFPDPNGYAAKSGVKISAPAFCDAGILDRSNGTRVCTREDVLKAIASRPLAFEPWTRPLYSNTGFNLLGWAIPEAVQQKTSGLKDQYSPGKDSQTVEDLLHKDVFEPLGMEDTSFWVPLDKRDNVAVPGKDVPSMIDWDFTSTFNPYCSLIFSNI
jgi:CubicO group peptidase (beta-lactamase class C family)